MLDVISRSRGNPNVAFAHCISGDFGFSKWMSARVAVAFRKMFELPKRSTCINNNLAIQQLEVQARI